MPWTTWGMWGKELIKLVHEEVPHRALLTAACLAADRCGLDEQHLQSSAGLGYSVRTWRRARALRKKKGIAFGDLQPPPRKGNFRQGFRRHDVAKVVGTLQEHSSERSATVRVKGEDVPKRALKRTYADAFEISGLSTCIPTSTLYRYARRHAPHIRPCKARLDICEKCHWWNTSFLKSVRPQISAWLAEATEVARGA